MKDISCHDCVVTFLLEQPQVAEIQWNQETIQLQGPGAADSQMIADLIRLNIPLP